MLGIEYVNQLLQVSQDINNLGVLNNFRLYTTKNSFATYYCHEKTREIEIDYSFELTAEQLQKNLDNNIDNYFEQFRSYFKNWYI
jgi:F0F1-type ATP synthase delta subunit